MSRDEYLHWRTNVAFSNEAKDSIVELKNGRTFKIRHRPMPGSGWVATHEDITEQRQAEVKIEHMAHHDSLTDLANRVLLNERLEQALGRFQGEQMVAVHHLDLDQFKAVNDTFGHPAGDKLLKIVADRLRGLVRETDTIARMGGDEFDLSYQPVVNLDSSEISGFEALLRWNHPERGQVPPATFIPLAEEIGFIVPLGEWVIRQACTTAAQWPEHMHVAVNISAVQFRGSSLMPVIVNALA